MLDDGQVGPVNRGSQGTPPPSNPLRDKPIIPLPTGLGAMRPQVVIYAGQRDATSMPNPGRVTRMVFGFVIKTRLS